MAHKKGMGSSSNGRESNSQRLVVKAYSGLVKAGTIIVRQRGTKLSLAQMSVSEKIIRFLPKKADT